METEIIFFGKTVILSCDLKCSEAWGMNWHGIKGEIAPIDPGTYEGDNAKPIDEKHNKWCARECERSTIKSKKSNTPTVENSEYYVDIANGKYTVYQEKGGTLKALRYKEPWQVLTGNNLVFYLMVELIEAKEKVKQMENVFNTIDEMNIDENDRAYIKNLLKGNPYGPY